MIQTSPTGTGPPGHIDQSGQRTLRPQMILQVEQYLQRDDNSDAPAVDCQRAHRGRWRKNGDGTQPGPLAQRTCLEVVYRLRPWFWSTVSPDTGITQRMTAWQGMLGTAEEAAQAGMITIKGFKDGLELGHVLRVDVV